jgi:putative membrane protein
MQGIGSIGRRRLCGIAVCSVSLLLASPVPARAEPNVPVPPHELISDDGEGRLSAADRDLVVKVRLAGLWEIPAGQMAQQKSQHPRIREIGREIAAQHQVLDALDRAAAEKLGIVVPKTPNSDQQGLACRDARGMRGDPIGPAGTDAMAASA